MKFAKYILIIFILFFGYSTTIKAQKEPDTNAKIKAVFLYNFTKYIEWPKGSIDESFKIGIYNNAEMYRFLTEMAAVKSC
ncbi:YfiR family protein [Vicingaceae bacterium]|nr:YfiR family protein [Vicingaceae bacterium]